MTEQLTRDRITLKGSAKIITEFFEWIQDKSINKLVLAVNSRETRETLELWQFDIRLEQNETPNPDSKEKDPKTVQQINSEIQAIIRQITASVTFLPIIEEKCTFNILIYADMGVQVPTTWIDSDPHHVKNSEQVKLRSFSTDVHRVDAMVAYRRDPGL
ncbi:Mitotic spindle checkpoint component mad2 [Smittium mucronatum]|uniref:Mitotic spindle checkpoint component mad2 n=1 Tax=Smittium mucronatum TaxID=133383 RepID=A0A1R0H583_9FUNG|nr:Mitotic spindle checkpoint component mad2 [Smittium mucronatum]